MRILERAGHLVTASLMLHPGYSLVLTGHSLGAGTAELLTMDLLEGQAKRLLPPRTSVRCIALAPPPVFRAGEQPLSSSVQDAIEIYVNNSDIVPRLSLASVAHLLACLRAVDTLKLPLATQFSILTGEDGELLDGVVKAVRGATQDTFPYLEVGTSLSILSPVLLSTPARYTT